MDNMVVGTDTGMDKGMGTELVVGMDMVRSFLVMLLPQALVLLIILQQKELHNLVLYFPHDVLHGDRRGAPHDVHRDVRRDDPHDVRRDVHFAYFYNSFSFHSLPLMKLLLVYAG